MNRRKVTFGTNNEGHSYMRVQYPGLAPVDMVLHSEGRSYQTSKEQEQWLLAQRKAPPLGNVGSYARDSIRSMRRNRRERVTHPTLYVLSPRNTYKRIQAMHLLRERISTLRQRNRTVNSQSILLRPPGHTLRQQEQRLARQLRENAAPSNGAEHVGIELEFCLPSAHVSSLQKALIKNGFGALLSLKGDGSVAPDEDDSDHIGREIAACIPYAKLAETVERLCNLLHEHEAYVNTTCGLHIHLDMRASTGLGRTMRKAYGRFFEAQDLLFDVHPQSRRHNNYCQRNVLDYDEHVEQDDRYYAINTCSYAKYSTLEIRCAAGTTSATKIVAWVNVLRSIADTPVAPSSVARLRVRGAARVWKWDANTLSWVMARMYAHAPQSRWLPRIRAKRAAPMPFAST